jgi:hypothetical protein
VAPTVSFILSPATRYGTGVSTEPPGTGEASLPAVAVLSGLERFAGDEEASMAVPTSRSGQRATPSDDASHAAAPRFYVCAECEYAQLFAVQPRALCTCHGGPHEGEVLFAGQMGCPNLAPRSGADLLMAWCAPGPKAAGGRVGRKPDRAH